MNLRFEVEGEFQPFAVRKDGDGNIVSKRALAPLQKNLVTNAGLDNIGNGTFAWDRLHIGVGTTEPAFGDTRLASWLASTNTQYQTYTNSGSTDAEMRTADVVWGGVTVYFSFAPGQAVGNITELGLNRTADSNSDLFTRALIKDEAGQPTSISVQPGEYLYVAYTMRIYLNAKDVTGSFTWNSQTINYVAGLYNCQRAAGDRLIAGHFGSVMPNASSFAERQGIGAVGVAWNADGAVARVNDRPAGHSSPALTGAYVPGTYRKDTVLTWAPNVGNTGLMHGIAFDVSFMSYRLAFLTPIQKTSDYTLTITIRQTWGRYTP